MRSLHSRPTVALLGGLLLAAAACASPTAPEALVRPGAAQLSVVLRDAPAAVRTAVVTIDRIYLQGKDGRTVLREEDATVDLLALGEQMATLVDAAAIPSGRYEGLHFVISGGYVAVEQGDGSSRIYASEANYAGLPDGAEVAGTLVMPSAGTSGLKVQLPAALDIWEGAQAVLVDVDVRESFPGQAGLSGKWVLTPVLSGERVRP